MFDSLRDRKSNRKDEVSTAVESGEDIPEIAETAAKASPGRATARQTPATRSAAGAQRSTPTIPCRARPELAIRTRLASKS